MHLYMFPSPLEVLRRRWPLFFIVPQERSPVKANEKAPTGPSNQSSASFILSSHERSLEHSLRSHTQDFCPNRLGAGMWYRIWRGWLGIGVAKELAVTGEQYID
jgi:hypothetical protein